LDLVFLETKLGDSDPDVKVIAGWVNRDLTKRPPTRQELDAAERIKKKLQARARK